jgi:hypothetical protein
MAERGTFEALLAELGQMLLPLREALSSSQSFLGFMVQLGWVPDDVPQPLGDLRSGLDSLYADLTAVLGPGGIQVSGGGEHRRAERLGQLLRRRRSPARRLGG